jgi:hypothetical protein
MLKINNQSRESRETHAVPRSLSDVFPFDFFLDVLHGIGRRSTRARIKLYAYSGLRADGADRRIVPRVSRSGQSLTA